MLTRIPWLGPWLKGQVEAHIAAHLIDQAGHHAVIGLAWIGAIFTVSALCQKSRWRWLGPVLVDLTFIAYIAFCIWAVVDAYAEIEAFRSGWTAYLTGASVLSAAWAGGLSLLVFLAANKILGYLPLEMLDTFGGGLLGHLRRWLGGGRTSTPSSGTSS